MVRLSVNLNKIALIRNARGANYPDLLKVAADCERFGAEGITVHPRPDERHVRFSDCPELKIIVTTEFNIEGYPSDHFLSMIEEVKPHQVTLVPDKPDALTSDHGWDTVLNKDFLIDTIARIKATGARVSVFIDPIEQLIEGAKTVGADRIEFYTGYFAHNFSKNPLHAVEKYALTAPFAHQIGLGINAGHDLNLDNLTFFRKQVPHLLEVSIGHALITDALYYGLENTIQMYQRCLKD